MNLQVVWFKRDLRIREMTRPVDEPRADSSSTRRTIQHRVRIDSRDRSWAAGLANSFDSDRFQAFSMESAATGVLQSVAP